MTLNQWGDFFAGTVAPLAFLWLILGYMQQGEEVRSNTDTLKLQQAALQSQVEETSALARHAEQQVKLAGDRLELERQQFERLRAGEPAIRILEYKGQTVTVDELHPGQFGGPAAISTQEYAIEDCDVHAVRLRLLASGAIRSVPLEQVVLSEDPQHQRRLKLTIRPLLK